MNEVSLSSLYAAQAAASAGSSAANTRADGGAFSALLAQKLNETASGTGAASVSARSSASSASSALSSTMMNALSGMSGLSGLSGGSDNTQMLLLILVILCSQSSGESEGINALSAALGGVSSGGNLSSAALDAAAARASSLSTAITNAAANVGYTADSAAVQAALTRLGDPYSQAKRGTEDYVDCSYLVKWAYEQVGVTLPSTAAAQAKYCYDKGYEISKDELQPGDLVFWSNASCDCGRWNEIHHVGIYAGNNKVIEARSSAGKVVINPIWGENGSEWKIAMYARPQAA